MPMTNEEVFTSVHPDYFPYYRSWCHDQPILISRKRDRELHRLQQLLYRVCAFYVQHYEEYLDLLPYEEKVLELLRYAGRYPFRAGTFRPDYIISEQGEIKVCEITSRFFGNGYFMSYFMEKAGEAHAREAGVTDRISYFKEFFDHMAEMSLGYRRLLVLKSADKSDSIKLYVPFYKALGLETVILEAADVEANTRLFRDSMIVSALNQKDLLSFSMDTLQAMADAGCRNDFRTVFLLHGKRFFHLFFRDAFTSRVLNEEETAFLRAHTIRTAIAGTDAAMWADAKSNKDGYILKHHCLGKSEKVYAGPLTDAATWQALFESPDLNDMILQPFIWQKRFTGTFKGEPLTDYVSPSIFCVDDRYFGTGLFRTSGCPVINQGDAHKIAPILTDEADRFKGCHML